MSNEVQAPIQINFKTKKDGMFINLRANDGIHLDMLLGDITERLAALIDLEKTTEDMAAAAAPAPSATQVIQNAFPGAQVVHQGAVQRPMPQAPAPAGVAPDCTCGFGPMRFVKAGISKSTGKPYRAFYACPQPQETACKNRVNA